jgi:hypothetical protein
MKKPQPKIAVFCRCGAQWYGVNVTDNAEVLYSHRQRCGPPISEEKYAAMFIYKVRHPKWWDAPRKSKVGA